MSLAEEQTLIRDMARKFAAERLAPGAGDRDREARFPADEARFPANEVREVGELGLM